MFFIVLDLRLTKVEYSGTPFFMPFPIAPFVFDKKNHPVRMKNQPARMKNLPAWMKNQPIWMKILPIPDGMTSPSCALTKRQTYPISPPSCTKDRHGPPFYSSQEENAGARKRKDKYRGDRWREIPPPNAKSVCRKCG